jgi:hypothetical protein
MKRLLCGQSRLQLTNMHPILNHLYDEIGIGDTEHRKWLWDKMEDFSKRTFKEWHCPGHKWSDRLTSLPDFDDGTVYEYAECEICGTVKYYDNN